MDTISASVVITAELVALLLFVQLSRFTKTGWKSFAEEANLKGSWEFVFDNIDYCIIYAVNILILYVGLILSFVALGSDNPFSIAGYTLSVIFMVLFTFAPIITTDITRQLIFDKQKYSWSVFMIVHALLSGVLILILFLSSRVIGYSVSMGLIVLLIIMFDEYYFYHLVRMFSKLVSEDTRWAIEPEQERDIG